MFPTLSRQLVERHRPVAQLLTALVLVCLLPGIVGMAIFLVAEYREGRQRYTEDTLQIARTIGEGVDRQVRRTQALARALAQSEELVAGDLPAFERHAAPLLAAAATGGQARVYRRDGSLLGEDAGTPAPLRAAELEALRASFEGKPVPVTNVLAKGSAGIPVVYTFAPVRREGRIVYVLAIELPTTALTAILVAAHLPEGWLASLLDPQCIIAGRNRGADKFTGQSATAKLCEAIARSETGKLQSTTRDGVENFTVFHRSPNTGYTSIVGVPKARVIGPLWTKLAYLAAIATVLSCFGLFLARRMSRRIAGAIQALTEPAAALGQGRTLAIRAMHVSEAAEVAEAIERAGALLRERDAALGAQQEELQQFKFFTENANEMLLLLDEQGHIRYANRMTSERLGYGNAELLSMTLFQIDLPTTPERLQAVFEDCRQAQKPPFERVYRCKDGSDIPVEITATVLQHRGEWLMYVAPRDIRERRQAEQAVRWAASHDGLTGLANRAQATRFLERALARAKTTQAGGALLFVDLDRFKPVNDLHGHEVGDRVLQAVAHRMQACVHDDELLARVGGDEFVLIMPRLTGGAGQAQERAAALIEAVSQPVKVGNIEVQLCGSIGISCFPGDGDTSSALIHAADMAMLQVKQNGRAGFACYSSAMNIQAQLILGVERRLQQALEHGGLAVHYQPIMDLASGRIEGVEALVRLEDGVAPAVGPATFIPIAESCGLVAPIGEWVMREACRQQMSWQATGLPLSVSVNVSALQFRRAGFVSTIRALLDASGIDPRRLVIELTETAVMENLAEAVEILEEVRALGVRVALDDFGTGYSSLSMLSTLPLDKLKIDQSFVRRIETDHASRAVIDAVIALAGSLGLELVAEGIETEMALAYLRERGCQLGQGYYFSRPLPVAGLEEWRVRQDLLQVG